MDIIQNIINFVNKCERSAAPRPGTIDEMKEDEPPRQSDVEKQLLADENILTHLIDIELLPEQIDALKSYAGMVDGIIKILNSAVNAPWVRTVQGILGPYPDLEICQATVRLRNRIKRALEEGL